MFNNVDNERLSYEALRHQTHRLCEEAKVEYRGEHVFRPPYLRYELLLQGGDVKVISKLLGHADVNAAYNIYVHLYGDGFDELYAAFLSEK